MWRHPALQDLSRDHYDVLVLVKRIEQARSGTPRAPQAQDAEATVRDHAEVLRLHFAEEETLLAPSLPDELRARLLADHTALLRDLGDPAIDLGPWGERLRAHVRWEERTVFPWLQEHLDGADLEALHEASGRFRRTRRGPESVGPANQDTEQASRS